MQKSSMGIFTVSETLSFQQNFPGGHQLPFPAVISAADHAASFE